MLKKDKIRNCYQGVEFISFDVENQENQTFFQAPHLQAEINKLSKALANKEEKYKNLQQKVELLTQQKKHRDIIIEEHKTKQKELRNAIERLKKSETS